MQWIPLENVIEIVKDASRRVHDGWNWYRNTRCKYINVRIDMRDGHCVIQDRHGTPISLEELKYQYKKDEDS